MSNYLKIYDFVLKHKTEGNAVTYFHLVPDNVQLHNILKQSLNLEEVNYEDVSWGAVFKAFSSKFSSDLNTEVLKNEKQKKLIKKKVQKIDGRWKIVELLENEADNTIYGVLHGGKITDNVTLGKVAENQSEDDYENLNGDRIYDDFFFCLHISFRCNIARLFILSRAGKNNVDSILKNYLQKHLFIGEKFSRTKVGSYIPEEFRKEALDRTILKRITVSKLTPIIVEDDGQEFEVEIKFKPTSNGIFKRKTKAFFDYFKQTKIILPNTGIGVDQEVDDQIKVSIDDPNSKSKKTFVLGNEDNFTPSLILEDEEILNANNEFDINNSYIICKNYIKYEEDVLL